MLWLAVSCCLSPQSVPETEKMAEVAEVAVDVVEVVAEVALVPPQSR